MSRSDSSRRRRKTAKAADARATTLGTSRQRDLCPTPEKATYLTRRHAKDAIGRLQKILDNPKGLRAYRCDCGRFHIGHPKPLRDQA